jgi:two-component system NarL family response regulator
MSEKQTIRILIADDHFLVRLGLSALIDSEPGLSVVAEAANGLQAVELFRRHVPDVAILDLRMPHMTGVDATRAILKEFSDARIVVVTTYDGDEDIYRALQAGARSYVLKDAKREELLFAVREVYAGRRHIPPAVAARLAERFPLSDLTSRELEVLELVVKGFSNGEVASTLKITSGTVKMHMNSVLSKLGVKGRTQAARVALERGIVHMD